jgi:hypothetical protein
MTLNSLQALKDGLNSWLESKPFNCVVEFKTINESQELVIIFDNPVVGHRVEMSLDISSREYQSKMSFGNVCMCLEAEKNYIKVLLSEAIWS